MVDDACSPIDLHDKWVNYDAHIGEGAFLFECRLPESSGSNFL